MRPYAVEIGVLANAWNQLHFNLNCLFVLLLKAQEETFSKAVWYAAESDFVQRKMLRSIIEADQNTLPHKRKLTKLQAGEILWVLDQIEKPLRHQRNNALHAPLMIVTGLQNEQVRSRALAHFDSQNPRAKPLQGKDLINEFRDYTAHSDVLTEYTSGIWHALKDPAHRTWPERPALPQAHKKKRKPHPGTLLRPPRQREASSE
jgi:hypothetical protein